MDDLLTKEVEAFRTDLKRRHIEGSMPAAKRTTELIRLLLTTKRHVDGQQLLSEIRSMGANIQKAKPAEVAIGNMVRRVLHMIREEIQRENEGKDPTPYEPESTPVAQPQPDRDDYVDKGPGLLTKIFRTSGSSMRSISLHNLLDPPVEEPSHTKEAGKGGSNTRSSGDRAETNETETENSERQKRRNRPQNWRGKQEVLEQVNELLSELDKIAGEISMQALEHMHANEIILTFGHSNTAQLFLQEAGKKRNFQVVVAEGAPDFGGHKLARALAASGINTTAIPDSSIFAMMARCNKVLIGAHAILANGGVMAQCGSHLLALAAQHHSVPFVVLAGLHKLCPHFPHDPSLTCNDFKSPALIADYSFASAGAPRTLQWQADDSAEFSHVVHPTLDYVPPELISLFITDTGGHTTSYVYRLLAEYYTREDYALSQELLNGCPL